MRKPGALWNDEYDDHSDAAGDDACWQRGSLTEDCKWSIWGTVSANAPIVLRTTTGQSSIHHRIYHQLYGVNRSRGVSKKLKSTMHWAVLVGGAECKRRGGGGGGGSVWFNFPLISSRPGTTVQRMLRLYRNRLNLILVDLNSSCKYKFSFLALHHSLWFTGVVVLIFRDECLNLTK